MASFSLADIQPPLINAEAYSPIDHASDSFKTSAMGRANKAGANFLWYQAAAV